VVRHMAEGKFRRGKAKSPNKNFQKEDAHLGRK
jgi:hypothetical protein